MGADSSKISEFDELHRLITQGNIPANLKEHLEQLYIAHQGRFNETTSKYERLKVDSGLLVWCRTLRLPAT